MPQAASITVHCPPAPVQGIPQASRAVSVVIGTNAPAISTLQTSETVVSFSVDDATAKVSVSISEVLANGNASAPVSFEFVPFNQVQAVAADPSQFKVDVVLK